MSILEYILSFSIFVILQGLAINGIKEVFDGKEVNELGKGMVTYGNVFYPLRKWLSKYISEYWQKPLWGCIRCMASFYGTITFFVTVLPLFGFNLFEVWVWVCDIFILVTVNWLIYKRV